MEDEETDEELFVETIDLSILFSSFKAEISCSSFKTMPSCSFSRSTRALAGKIGCVVVMVLGGVFVDIVLTKEARDRRKCGEEEILIPVQIE